MRTIDSDPQELHGFPDMHRLITLPLSIHFGDEHGIYNHTLIHALVATDPLRAIRTLNVNAHPIWTSIQRGLLRRCPACGQGKLFQGFLKVRPRCSVCAANNGAHPSDDLPPYATIVIVGHVVVPLFCWFDRSYSLPLSMQFAIWLPLTALLTIGLLPFVKGGVIGLCRATGIVRPDAP